MTNRLHVLGAATSAGAHGPGQERAPETFRGFGLIERLADDGHEVVDHGDVVRLRMRPDPEHPQLRSADRVVAAAHVVAAHVHDILRDDPHARILILGGDCTIQLGVIAGAKAASTGTVGLAYVDLDCDLTSPADGNGVADWMGVTHLVDAPDADPRLAALDGRPPLLTPDTLRLVAADLATAYERDRLTSLGITRFTSDEVGADTAGALESLISWADHLSLLSVHVDVDVLDQTRFPIAEEQRDTPGLSLDVLERLVTGLMAHPAARLLTICEVNPDRPAHPAAAFEALIGLLTRSLGPRNAATWRRRPQPGGRP